MGLLEQFVDAYLQLRNPVSQLHKLNASFDANMSGAFNLFGLDTHFSFQNNSFIAWIEREGEFLEREAESSGEDIYRSLDDSELEAYLKKNPAMLDMFRARELAAHEHFHVLQALTLRSVFSLAQAYRTIGQWRNYFGVMVLHSGATFKQGECIFDALRNIPDYENLLGSTLHDLSKKANLALNVTKIHAQGLSMLDLIEGSAFFAQKIAVRTFAVPTFNVADNPIYSGAWQVYQTMGGRDEMTFLLVCLAALRFGDIKRGYAHPVDIFLSLAQEATTFESTWFEPPSLAKCFGFTINSNEDNDEKYFAHLHITNQRQIDSLALYRRQATEEVNHAVDEALKISKKIAEYVKAKFESVGAPVDENQVSASYIDDFLRAFGMGIYEQFPAVNTEEFCLRFLFDTDIYNEFSHFAIDAAGEVGVQEIGGNMLNGDEARALHSILNRFESLALYDPDEQSPLPYCCDIHPNPGDFDQVIECQQEGSLNAVIREICGRELHELFN